MFGWCADAVQFDKAHLHKKCPVKYQRFYSGQKRIKRKMVDAIIWLDEWRECNCKCHRPKPEKPVRKTRKKT